MRRQAANTLVLVLAALAFAACATSRAPDPAVATPATWGGAASEGSAVTREWFRGFGSAELDELIAAAARNSFDIQAADARLRQADARARQAGAAILPQVEFDGNSNYYTGHSVNGSAHETDYAALLSASYEIDFWGKNRAARASAVASRRVSREDRDTLVLSTLTGVANTYFEVVALGERVQLAQAAARNAEDVLDVVQRRQLVGLATPTQLAEQRALAAAARVHTGELEQQEASGVAALALLAGDGPGALRVEGHSLAALSEPRISAGLPSELLTRRPDVQSAEDSLRAAHADLVRARAELFPSVSLTASGGIQNPAVNAAVIALAGAGPSLALGAGLVQPIFDGGRLRAARDEAAAHEEEMIAHYRAAALSAFWDVQSALTAIHSLDGQQIAQQESLSQTELALAGAEARYREGAGDFLTLLDAQRNALSARDQLIQYRLARLQAVVGLCKALGGGWTPVD